tara:strand:- start:7793 stop:9559 length:1767 start_codon:yes stop_codon:yes gene_type:complete
MLIEPPKPNLSGRAVIEDMHESSGVPTEMTNIQIADVREYLNADLFAFNWLIFNHTDLIGSVHGEICNLLNLWGWIRLKDGSWTKRCDDPDLIETDYRRLMIQIPREFFKTSVATRANALWQICREPDQPVVIVNERLANAKKWLGAIRDIVEGNVLFQVVYADLLPPGVGQLAQGTRPQKWKWSDEHMDFQGKQMGEAEYSLSAMGIGAASAGGHWPKMIKDDLISEDAAYSVSVMEQAKDWFDKSFYLERPAQKGMDLINCTRWGWGDLYDYAAEKYGYTVYTRSALEAEDGTPDLAGTSIFPSKLSTKELQKQAKRDPIGFWSQMMNHPKAGAETSFDIAWCKSFSGPVEVRGRAEVTIDNKDYDPNLLTVDGADLDYLENAPQTTPDAFISRAVILDPAQSKKSQKSAQRYARHGLVCAGYDPYGRVYVFESLAFRAEPKETLETVIEMALRWNTPLVAIEDVAFSEVYMHFLDYMLKHDEKYRDVELQVIPVTPAGRQKDSRVLKMIPFIRQGFYHFRPESCKPVLQEMQEYPYGMTVDCVDALAYLPEVVARPETPTEIEQGYIRKHEEFGPGSGRDPVCGY